MGRPAGVDVVAVAWRARLSGHEFDLHAVAEILPPDDDPSIERAPDGSYWLTALAIDNAADLAQRMAVARGLVTQLVALAGMRDRQGPAPLGRLEREEVRSTDDLVGRR